MRLTKAMRRQLVALYEVQVQGRSSGGRSVNLSTIKALHKLGLVEQRYGDELRIRNRLHNAYPLTTAGRDAVEKGQAHG